MVATADADYTVPRPIGRSTGNGLYVRVGDVPAIYAAAIEAGASLCVPAGDDRMGRERARVHVQSGSAQRAARGRAEPAELAAGAPRSRRS